MRLAYQIIERQYRMGETGILVRSTIIANDLTIGQAINWIQHCKFVDAEFNLGCCDYYIESHYSCNEAEHLFSCEITRLEDALASFKLIRRLYQ